MAMGWLKRSNLTSSSFAIRNAVSKSIPACSQVILSSLSVDKIDTAGEAFIFAVSILTLEDEMSKVPKMNEPKKDTKSE